MSKVWIDPRIMPKLSQIIDKEIKHVKKD